MRYEDWCPLFGQKYNITVPLEARKKLGIQSYYKNHPKEKSLGRVKVTFEEWQPPDLTEEEIVSEELEEIKHKKDAAPTSREVKAKGEGALKKLMGA